MLNFYKYIFILKLIFIKYNLSLFLNKLTSDSDYEIVYFPKINSLTKFQNFSIKTFGEDILLNLMPNKNLMILDAEINILENDLKHRIFYSMPSDCYFTHMNSLSIGSFNLCKKYFNGLLFFDTHILEIYPANFELKNEIILNQLKEPLEEDDKLDYKVPYIIKRSTNHPIHSHFMKRNINDEMIIDFDEDGYLNEVEDYYKDNILKNINQNLNETKTKRFAKRLTIELAIFFDERAYRLFSPYIKNDNELIDLLLAYINGVQALYHHPSIGEKIDIAIVRIDIMKTQPIEMPHYNGERSLLLESFCNYQNKLNLQQENEISNSKNWDMAVYISGLDFYAIENGIQNDGTMGLATVGGVCLKKYNCVIAELGTTNIFGKPYPSAGFTSVYILAHEMGHNLGMSHDGYGNYCPKEGYIMSPSRGTNGETIWSHCSAQVMLKLKDSAKCLQNSPETDNKLYDHYRIFLNRPGQKYNAKRQCEILLKDPNAYADPNQDLSTICNNLECKTPHRSGFYYSGPALEGTTCGDNKICSGGECIKVKKSIAKIPGHWSDWKIKECKSGCIQNSLGYQEKIRTCTSDKSSNTNEGCEGLSYQVEICKYKKKCKKMYTPTEYASEKCREFSKILPQLDSVGYGLQAPFEQGRPWMSCSIFCQRKDNKSYYTPRIELNDLGISSFFPDGTKCHNDSSGNYYCMQHHCLPQNFKFSKRDGLNMFEDLPIPQNANPFYKESIPSKLIQYFSLDMDGNPLENEFPHQEKVDSKYHEFNMIDDYLNLPDDILNNFDY